MSGTKKQRPAQAAAAPSPVPEMVAVVSDGPSMIATIKAAREAATLRYGEGHAATKNLARALDAARAQEAAAASGSEG